jgi:hypothetical protein
VAEERRWDREAEWQRDEGMNAALRMAGYASGSSFLIFRAEFA